MDEKVYIATLIVKHDETVRVRMTGVVYAKDEEDAKRKVMGNTRIAWTDIHFREGRDLNGVILVGGKMIGHAKDYLRKEFRHEHKSDGNPEEVESETPAT